MILGIVRIVVLLLNIVKLIESGACTIESTITGVNYAILT